VDFDGRTEDYVITGGYLEVHESQAVVLAESCENRNDIDLEQAKQDLDAARRKLDAAADSVEQSEAQAALDRARARVDVATYQRS
jgi:F-type H+-transporting ATPase subunit epsilon